MPVASIVIRCLNEGRHLAKLLEGISQQTVRDVEVLVVDSGSTDDTLEVARRFPVRILQIRPEEFSFGRSLNVGCAAARGEFLVFASAHCYPVFRDWLEKLLAPFSDPAVALTYGRQRGNEVTKYAETQVFNRWFPNRSQPRQTHPFCNNANAAVRRSVWERQPYDETLTGLEDLDWAKRALKAGHFLSYVAEAEIVHVHDEPPRRILNRYRREAIAFHRIFPEERFSFRDFVRLVAANVASDYFHAWHDGALLANVLGIPTFRLMQFWGTYRGFRHRGPVGSGLQQIFYYPNDRVRAESTGDPSDGRGEVQYVGPEIVSGRVD